MEIQQHPLDPQEGCPGLLTFEDYTAHRLAQQERLMALGIDMSLVPEGMTPEERAEGLLTLDEYRRVNPNMESPDMGDMN
jgi:hypothetical protein